MIDDFYLKFYEKNGHLCRIAGLDVGEKTVGIAISDTTMTIASSLVTLNRKNLETDCKNVKAILSEFDIGGLIYGWPIEMSGICGSQCKFIKIFIDALENYISCPMCKFDERLSTKAVERILLEANLSRKKRKKVIDRGAACYILQGALDRLKRLGKT